MMIHARTEDAGARVLAVDDVAEGPADGSAVLAEVRVLSRGEEGEEAEPGDPRAVLAAGPVALVALLGGEEGEPAVVHLTDVPGDDLAVAGVVELGRGRSGRDDGHEQRREQEIAGVPGAIGNGGGVD